MKPPFSGSVDPTHYQGPETVDSHLIKVSPLVIDSLDTMTVTFSRERSEQDTLKKLAFVIQFMHKFNRDD